MGIEYPVRKPMIRLVRWQPFDPFMLVVILCNCITLAMSSNKPGFSDSTLGIAIQRANYAFIALFIAEMCCKVIALGFVVGRHTYLRNGEVCSRSATLVRHALRMRRLELPRLFGRRFWNSGALSLGKLHIRPGCSCVSTGSRNH